MSFAMADSTVLSEGTFLSFLGLRGSALTPCLKRVLLLEGPWRVVARRPGWFHLQPRNARTETAVGLTAQQATKALKISSVGFQEQA